MERGLVSESGSENNMGGGGTIDRSAPHFAYELFYREFPYYLAIGMTTEQYWDGDASLPKYYRQAAQIKQDLQNQNLWLQGLYIYEALLDVCPVYHTFAKRGTKAIPYRSEPIPLRESQQEKRERKADNKAKVAMESFAVAFNRKFKEKPQDKGGG